MRADSNCSHALQSDKASNFYGRRGINMWWIVNRIHMCNILYKGAQICIHNSMECSPNEFVVKDKRTK